MELDALGPAIDDPVLRHPRFGVQRALRHPVVAQRRLRDLDEQEHVGHGGLGVLVGPLAEHGQIGLGLGVIREHHGILDGDDCP